MKRNKVASVEKSKGDKKSRRKRSGGKERKDIEKCVLSGWRRMEYLSLSV